MWICVGFCVSWGQWCCVGGRKGCGVFWCRFLSLVSWNLVVHKQKLAQKIVRNNSARLNSIVIFVKNKAGVARG